MAIYGDGKHDNNDVEATESNSLLRRRYERAIELLRHVAYDSFVETEFDEQIENFLEIVGERRKTDETI